MRPMIFRAESKRESVTLNMTPLIDVLFLFLIFFMLTGTFKRVGELELQLPDSSTAAAVQAEEEIRQVELVVTEDGALLLDQVDVEREALNAALGEIFSAHPDSRVLIKAETGVRHGEIVLLLDRVREAGFVRVGIGTQLKTNEEGSP